ncbi:MAG: 30S ribosomal protein S2, partial [Bacteroidales bacterium]|nr:30S ribosomal protein S2 [Bacteroidales bacterium]
SISDLNRLPAALFVVDVQKEYIAVHEAKRLNIPVFAMVDTCCDPTPIDFVIPANDDASKSIALIVDVMAKAIEEGLEERKAEKEKEPVAKEKKDEVTKTRARKGKKVEVEDEAKVEDADDSAADSEEDNE